MKNKATHITLILLILLVYLFVSAPPLLDADTLQRSLQTRDALSIINKLNGVARKLYTNHIVKDGKKAGLKFDENWEEDNVEAGPLPAQFLRLTSRALEESKVPLGLYLGSDYPINTANKFKGLQKQKFIKLKNTGESQYFYEIDTQRFYYMAEDVAISSACTSCHNKHDDSPKTDWKLNNIMGATTWSYPDKKINHQQLIEMSVEFYNSVKSAYTTYLTEIESFKGKKPGVSNAWPKSGFSVPDLKTFMREYEKLAGEIILQELVKLETVTEGELL